MAAKVVERWKTSEEGTPVSIDAGILEMYEKAKKEGIETAWDRFRSQQPQCTWGLDGTCCRRCFNGPCRIKSGVSLGICGADADTIAMRNLLELLTAGAAQHVEHAREEAEVLLKASEGKVPYQIKGERKLRELASRLGIAEDKKPVSEIAREVARRALEDFSRREGTLNWLQITANPKSREIWEKLGVMPRNAHAEIAMSVVRTSMGCDADAASLIKEAAAMSLVDGFAGLHMATDIQDVLFGTPSAIKTSARLGTLEKDAVNIAVHGHVPILSEKIVEFAETMESEARAAGATRINIVGVCCTGNEVMMRHGIPLANNFAGSEMVIVTGALDAMVVDVQCIMPSLAAVADCYHTEFITTLPYIRIPGATHVEFTPEKADECAQEIIKRAIEAYRKRDPNKIKIPDDRIEMYGGFSVEQIVEALKKVNPEDPLKPVIDSIANGNILGAVALVGCTGFKQIQDSGYAELAKYLLQRNVLVVATGCGAYALAKQGFMMPNSEHLKECGEGLRSVLRAVGQANGLESLPPVLHMGSCVDNSRVAALLNALALKLGVGMKDLPVAGSCPEVQNPKALSIGGYFLCNGVDVHIGVPLPVWGSETVAKALTMEKNEFPMTLDGLFGGKLIYDPDMKSAGEKIVARIMSKRRVLGLKTPMPAV